MKFFQKQTIKRKFYRQKLNTKQLHIEEYYLDSMSIPNNDEIQYGAKKYAEGVLHRIGGPATIEYFINGNIFCESYYQNGELHREDGPAEIDYYLDGKMSSETYYINDTRHRMDGPARIIYDSCGNILKKEYWIDGIRYNDVFKWMVAIATY